MIVRSAALLVALHWCVLSALPATEQRKPDPAADRAPFTIGVLRADGVVIPFASWDGRAWASDWPQQIEGLEIPINLESIPAKWWGAAGPQRKMTLWSEAEARGEVVLERPAVVPVLCDRRLGLRTRTVSSPPLPPPYEPFPKQGIVVSGPQRIESIARISTYSADFKALPSAIAEAAAAAEDAANRRFLQWSHPFPPAERRKVPLELEALYRVSMDEPGWGSAAYIEAVKRYPLRPWDNGCGLVTSVSGWIRRSPKGEPKYDLSARISYCDRAGATYMLPFGIVKVRGETYWIFQTSGRTGEWYSIVRPSSKAIEYHVDYVAGRGCPQ